MAASVASGCSSSQTSSPPVDPTDGIAEGCDPLVPEQCGFPLPNDYWRVTDGSGSGHLAFGASTLPMIAPLHRHIDPATWNAHDGFSPGQELVTIIPGATGAGLAGFDSIGQSLTDDSLTVVIDTSTGERVAHFSEIDLSTHRDDDQSLLIHPVSRLKDATRYVVAVRRVVDVDGKAIAASPAFANLRDKGAATKSAEFEARRPHFEDIFSILQAHGVARGDLQIAWDFTTASRAQNTRDMLAMRDAALATVGQDGPSYTITEVADAPNPYLSKLVTGMMTVPLYLDQPGPGAAIVRGPDGLPRQNGTAQYEFVMLIPKTISASAPLGILQNGHGLLGSKREGVNGYFAQICEQYGYVGIAVDWAGMAHDDIQAIIDASSGDLSKFERSVDRQHQGFINALLAMRMMKGRMQREPLLQQNSKPVFDPARAYYRGDSQGGIFGGTYMTISTDVTRGLLGEPGAPYTLLLDRSVDFSGYKFLLRGTYPAGRDLRVAYALLQMSWDRTEPDGYIPYMRANLLPGTPAHEVLIHAGIGDHQVSTLGAQLIARSIGAKNVVPANRPIWGVEDAPAAFTGSGIVEFDFGNAPVPVVNMPPNGPGAGEDPHDKVRELPSAQDQEDHFFRTGEIRSYCDGPCNPN